jgi:L-iditol 2-dehydrogenase
VRAALLHAPGELRVEEVDEPRPGPGEVVLEIRAAGSCGTDVKTYLRGHPTIRSYPARLGHEFAGVVAEVGEGVEDFAPGDEVFAANSAPCGACFQCVRGNLTLCEDLLLLLGGFAERLLVPERIVRRNLHWLPPGLALELAPLAEPLACAVRAVEAARVEPGERAAVIGGGALGLMLVAVLADAGAEPIVADPHEERLERAGRFGAVETVRAERGAADAEAIRALANDGRGADQAFEAIGRPETWEVAVASVRAGGAVNLFGGCPAESTFAVPTERVHYEEVTLRGTFHHTPRHICRALELLAAGGRPWQELAGPRIALEQLEDALAGRLGHRGKFTVVP